MRERTPLAEQIEAVQRATMEAFRRGDNRDFVALADAGQSLIALRDAAHHDATHEEIDSDGEEKHGG